MKMRFFDFEVLPHWWLCVFGDYPDDGNFDESCKKDFHIVNSDMPDARSKLMDLLKEDGYVMVGYNVKHYDLMIANGIYQGFSPEQVKMLNDVIINPSMQYETREHYRIAPFAKKKLPNVYYQDLMDDGDGTLKEKECILGLNVLESSVDFNQEVLSDSDKDDLTYYCKQDVYASMVFYKKIVDPYTKTKLAMGKHFNIPEPTCRSCTNARLVAIALKAKRQEFLDYDRQDIEIPQKVREYCYNNVPSKVLERIRTTKENFTINLFNNTVSFGNGGIHSVYKNNLYVESDDEWVLVNVDATSYYPSLMIQLGLLSRCVTDRQVFIDIFDERVAIKHKAHKTEEDMMAQLADKLVLNTTFGAAGNKYLDLYDPYMCTSVCKVGQIFLAALAMRLTGSIPDLKVIQTNTDGILLYTRRKYMPDVELCMKEWTDVSGINMEAELYSKIWQRDVNNYLLVGEDGHAKRKGGWLNDNYEKPGYVMVGALTGFVSAKAAKEFLLTGKNIIESIVANTNLEDFLISCKKGSSYSGVVQRLADGTEVPLFKCNRVIATKDKSVGKVYKYKMYKGHRSYTQMPNVPDFCKLMNLDISEYKFGQVRKELDYMYYIERAYDLLDIDWLELKGTQEFPTDKFKVSL